MINKKVLKGMMLQYSIVIRVYKDKEGKRIGYCTLTDGWTAVQISKGTMEVMMKQIRGHARYVVGHEQYMKATGDQGIDGYPIEDLELQSIVFNHIFIKANHLGEVFEDFENDRKIFFTEFEKEAICQK